MTADEAADDSRGQLGPGHGPSPTAARRRLGVLLRASREHARLTLEEAGEAVQRSAPTISRLETGKVKPRLVDVEALLSLYAERASGAVPATMRRQAKDLADQSRQEAWFSPFRDVLTGSMVSEHVRRLVELETDASAEQSYQPDLVPGLLQTRAYARAIADTYFPGTTEAERERFVEFRMQRQGALWRHGSPLMMHVILGDLVLRRSVGGRAVMREQLASLAEIVRSSPPNVTIQVAPAAVAVRGAIGGPFLVMTFEDTQDSDLVYLETRTGADYLQNEAELTYYRTLFRDLAEAALDRDASLATLEEAIKANEPE